MPKYPRILTRRQVLKSAVIAAPALFLARYFGYAEAATTQTRRIALLNTHTDESLEIAYFANGAYVTDALAQLNHLLRDHRSGEIGTIDPALFDVLHSVAGTCQADPMFEVISGFRSATSNEMLREQGGGVARQSLHLKGMAIDVRLRGVACTHLRDVGLDLARGGVGYYRKSNFVHLDTGRVRSWAG